MSEKPVGSEHPPINIQDVKQTGAEVSSQSVSPPPPYPSGPSGQNFQPQNFQPQNFQPQNFQPQQQQTYSPISPTSPQTPQYHPQQTYLQQDNRTLPPIPPGYTQDRSLPQQQSQSGYTNPQQPGITYVMQPQMNPQPQQVHVINVAATSPVAGPIYAHTPVQVVCPYCNVQVVTIVNETPGSTAYFWSLILFCIFCPLMFLPCFVSSLLDKTHTCPRCHRVLGQVKA